MLNNESALNVSKNLAKLVLKTLKCWKIFIDMFYHVMPGYFFKKKEHPLNVRHQGRYSIGRHNWDMQSCWLSVWLQDGYFHWVMFYISDDYGYWFASVSINQCKLFGNDYSSEKLLGNNFKTKAHILVWKSASSTNPKKSLPSSEQDQSVDPSLL